MSMNNLLWVYYFVCVIYCLWKLQKRYKNISTGGGLYVSPGLDAIMVLLIGWLLAPIDLIITMINKIR
jgi:hypothetical protein